MLNTYLYTKFSKTSKRTLSTDSRVMLHSTEERYKGNHTMHITVKRSRSDKLSKEQLYDFYFKKHDENQKTMEPHMDMLKENNWQLKFITQ